MSDPKDVKVQCPACGAAVGAELPREEALETVEKIGVTTCSQCGKEGFLSTGPRTQGPDVHE